jgi:hypothetical protein
MTFKIPKFEDGHILPEQDLYALGRLSIEFFRWNCIAGRNFGFFAPSEIDSISGSDSCNKFYWENDNLVVNNLFVISQQGYPFIIQGKKQIDKIGKTLFAVADLAKDSQSYGDGGYKIDFRWDLPEIESNPATESFLIELGQVTGSNSNRKFELKPPVLQLNCTSDLRQVVFILNLKGNIEKYIEKLIIAAGENNLDCDEYIDRLERLNLFSQNTEVDEFIGIALLTLKSATGFYHRLIYHQDKSKLQDRSCENLQGRVLEKELVKIQGNKIEPEIFDPIDELLKMEVKTGQQQQTFIEKLSYLFALNSCLSDKLKTTRQEIFPSKGYPKTYDIRRDLYRYEFSQNQKQGKRVIVEFNVEPTNVAFIFTSQDKISSASSTKTLIPLKQQSKQENFDRNRYTLLLEMKDYLFIAAPKQVIKVELIKAEDN